MRNLFGYKQNKAKKRQQKTQDVRMQPAQSQTPQARFKPVTEDESKETAKTLLDNISKQSQKMRNPYVILVGIEDYSDAREKYNRKWRDLNGVSIDINRMKKLWSNTYNYKNIKIALAGTKESDHGDALSDEASFNRFLINIRNKQMETNNKIDGLIFYYSGHGLENRIILKNGKSFWLKKIYKIFDSENCMVLTSKPKVMIFDCCRGNGISDAVDLDRNNTKGGGEWVNEQFHVDSGIATIFGNTMSYSVMDDTKRGGCLTRAIEVVFKAPQLIEKYNLRTLIMAIRRQTKIYSGAMATQLVDFHEGLEYFVYFRPFSNVNNSNIDKKTDHNIINHNLENSKPKKEEKEEKTNGKGYGTNYSDNTDHNRKQHN